MSWRPRPDDHVSPPARRRGPAPPPDAKRIRLHGEGAHADHVAQPVLQPGRDLLLAAVPFGPVGQRHHDEATDCQDPPCPAMAKILFTSPVSRSGFHQRLDLAHPLIGELQRHPLRRLHREQDGGAVLGRGQFLPQEGEAGDSRSGEKQSDEAGDQRRVQAQAQRGGVKAGEPAAKPHDGAAAFGMGPQETGGKHRRQGQRGPKTAGPHGKVKPNSRNSPPVWPGRNDSGTKTAARVEVVHREEHLLGAKNGGRAGTIPSADNVLQHHDGVIHHDAGCQHQRQKRQEVDRNPASQRPPACRSAPLGSPPADQRCAASRRKMEDHRRHDSTERPRAISTHGSRR